MLFEKLNKSSRIYYQSIWDENYLSKFKIDNKITEAGISTSSLAFVPHGSFKNRDEEIAIKIKTLIENFNIEDNYLFSKKFCMSISGSGDELPNMLTLISSALCPLLFFYNCENIPINIEINNKLVPFDKSFFEWKNPVIRNSSNMDIVLYSTSDNILLFIESKFTEYLKPSSNPISTSYLKNNITSPIYKNLFDLSYYELKYIDTSNKYFELQSNIPHYKDGIKQNISHYCGILNFLNNKFDKNNHYIKELSLNENTQYYFAEILFTNSILQKQCYSETNIHCFEDYSIQYEQLQKILSKDIAKREIKNFSILPRIYTYSKLAKDNPNLNKEVVAFYHSIR